MQTPTSIEVTIERILPGGPGLAHAEGLTLFVALAAPGDVVRVRIDRIRGKVAFASIEEIVKPSPVRVEPPCPYFGACGGCDFQQLNYQAQLDAKIEMIRDCLRRIAHIEQPPEISITPSPLQWHYRARANWQFDLRNQRLGYFERGSHRVCDVAECAVLVPKLQQTLEQLRREASSLVLTSEDGREDARQNAADIQAAAGDEGVSVVPALAGLSSAEISRRIGDDLYEFNAASFFQVNHDLLEALISEAINDASGESAVDLYCGVGLFTLALARRFERVVAVEANPSAARFARRNLHQAGISNTKVVTDRVGDWLRAKVGAAAPIDFLLLDPPRAGVEDDAIETLLNLKPRRLSYVSCDPATLARDLKALLAGGYSLDSLRAFDLFPQTHHVETVSHLRL